MILPSPIPRRSTLAQELTPATATLDAVRPSYPRAIAGARSAR